jgi:hypothetical protein
MPRAVLVLLVALTSIVVPLPAAAQAARTFGSFRATTSVAFTATRVDGERHAALAWRCMADGLNVIYLIGGEPVGREMDIDVPIGSAIDEHEAHTDRWTLLEGHRAVFLPREKVEAFTREAMTAERLSLRGVDPVSGERFADEFPLDGLRGALQYILPCQF